jgi:hypothetical protein
MQEGYYVHVKVNIQEAGQAPEATEKILCPCQGSWSFSPQSETILIELPQLILCVCGDARTNIFGEMWIMKPQWDDS